MWFVILLIYASSKQLPSIQGQSLILKNGSGPCEGYISILYKNEWGMVGTQKWNKKNEDVICKSINCGKSKNSTDYYYYTNEKDKPRMWLDAVECQGHEENLWDCTFPGWNVEFRKTHITKKITCSDKIDLHLQSLPGYKCAGSVKYNKTSTLNPNSTVITTGYFCEKEWGKKQADRVCEHVGCGVSKHLPKAGTFSENDQKEVSQTIKCGGVDHKHLWMCNPKDDKKCTDHVAVICTDHNNFRLNGESNACSGNLEVEDDKGRWIPVCQSKNASQILKDLTPATICKYMRCGNPHDTFKENTIQCDGNRSLVVNCSDQISTVLLGKDNESKCIGSVYFKVSKSNKTTMEAVCDDDWDKVDGKVACLELGCGEVMSIRSGNQVKDGKHGKVQCKDSDTSLWHCLAKHNDKPVTCKTAYLMCTGSVDVQLSDGPGRCAGRVEIQYENKWRSVKTSNWNPEYSKVMCKSLGCGNDSLKDQDKFIEGTSPEMTKRLTCNSESTFISKCITETEHKKPNEKNVMLVCQAHKLVFLRGNSSCSGTVEIEQNGKNYWLSNDTWNHETATVVCKQMHCGNPSKVTFESVDTAKVNIRRWNHSYNCSSTEKSLFECKESSSASKSMAYVECSGNKSVRLTSECYGYVDVCLEGKCGGVCEEAWDDFRSTKLCEELGCGVSMPWQLPYLKQEPPKVAISSIHLLQNTVPLSQSVMVTNDGSYCQDRQYVVCSDSAKFRLQDNRDKCSGNIQLRYQGEWLFVCKDALDENAQNGICQELGCGNATNAIIPSFNISPEKDRAVVERLTCTDKTRLSCHIAIAKKTCQLTGLRCSEWRRMLLDKGKRACEGQVVMYSNTDIAAVSSDNWTETEAKVLCKSLGCGAYKSHSVKDNPGDMRTWWEKTFSCEHKPNGTNIWECEMNNKTTGRNALHVDCNDHESFPNNNGCDGKVMLNGKEVCSESWTRDQSNIVCSERQCGLSIQHSWSLSSTTSNKGYVVSCHGPESSLQQCKTEEGTCKQVVSVSCTDPVQFNFTEKCGGQILVYNHGKWDFVCPFKNIVEEAKMLCKEKNCGVPQRLNKNKKNSGMDFPSIKTSLKCKNEEEFLKFCIQPNSCESKEPGEIYCSDYVSPLNEPNLTSLIVGLCLAAFALAMFIILVLFLRKRFVTRFKSRFSMRKETAFESGEYEDVETNEMFGSTEMGDVKQHEIVGEKENGRQSVASSQSYDDVEEEGVVTQPLTRGSDATSSPVPEARPVTSKEHVSYEMEEDSQDSYDDILSETRDEVADVHEMPKPMDMELHDEEDYLEPDG